MSTPLSENFNPAYTPEMQFAPVTAGSYSAKVQLQDPDPTTRWEKVKFTDNDGKVREYYRARIKATITDGPSAGRVVFGKLTTGINKMGGTKCHDVIVAAKQQELLFKVATHEDLCEAVDIALSDDPELTIVVVWEAPLLLNDGTKDWTKMLRGAKSWPDEVNPKTGETYKSHIKRVEEGTYVAQSVINGFRA